MRAVPGKAAAAATLKRNKTPSQTATLKSKLQAVTREKAPANSKKASVKAAVFAFSSNSDSDGSGLGLCFDQANVGTKLKIETAGKDKSATQRTSVRTTKGKKKGSSTT